MTLEAEHPPVANAAQPNRRLFDLYTAPASTRYEDSYRLCYVRGPEGIIIELVEQIG